MLTKLDDYLAHQLPDPMNKVSSPEPEWMEHSCMWFRSPDPEPHIPHVGVGLTVYPNTGVKQGWCLASIENQQYNCRFWQDVTDDRSEMTLGPLHFEVIEPLKRWKVKLNQDPHFQVAFDIEIEGRFPFYEFRETQISQGGLSSIAQKWRYAMQLTRARGSLTIAGKKFNVKDYVGMRDRAWGARTTVVAADLMLVNWAHFPSFGIQLAYFESADGTPGWFDGAIWSKDGKTSIVKVEHDIDWVQGTGDIKSAEFRFFDAGGKKTVMTAQRIALGTSYKAWWNKGDPWVSRGPLHLESEMYDGKDLQILASVSEFTRETPVIFRCNGETGTGIFEHMLKRTHKKYGRYI